MTVLRTQRGGERGSGTILVLSVAVLLALLAASVVLVGQAMILRHRAGAAADLAALAGADSAGVGTDPCAAAARIALADGARLLSCTAGAATTADPLLVRVVVSAPVLGGRTLAATADARAGRAAP